MHAAAPRRSRFLCGRLPHNPSMETPSTADEAVARLRAPVPDDLELFEEYFDEMVRSLQLQRFESLEGQGPLEHWKRVPFEVLQARKARLWRSYQRSMRDLDWLRNALEPDDWEGLEYHHSELMRRVQEYRDGFLYLAWVSISRSAQHG